MIDPFVHIFVHTWVHLKMWRCSPHPPPPNAIFFALTLFCRNCLERPLSQGHHGLGCLCACAWTSQLIQLTISGIFASRFSFWVSVAQVRSIVLTLVHQHFHLCLGCHLILLFICIRVSHLKHIRRWIIRMQLLNIPMFTMPNKWLLCESVPC